MFFAENNQVRGVLRGATFPTGRVLESNPSLEKTNLGGEPGDVVPPCCVRSGHTKSEAERAPRLRFPEGLQCPEGHLTSIWGVVKHPLTSPRLFESVLLLGEKVLRDLRI